MEILVPLDGSPLAQQALPYARLLAKLLDAPTHLLSIVTQAAVDQIVSGEAAIRHELGDSEVRGFGRTTAARELLTAHAESYLGLHVRELVADGFETIGEVQIGPPAEVICASMRQSIPSLVVLTPDKYDGSTAQSSAAVLDKVLETNLAPVLVVRTATVARALDRQPLVLRRLLVPVADPATAQLELDWALRLAQPADAEVLLLHADPLEAHDSSLHYQERQQAGDQLEALAARVSADHKVSITAMTKGGVIDNTIISTARSSSADMIVMAAASPNRLKRLLFSSIVDTVRRATPVPLLIIPRH